MDDINSQSCDCVNQLGIGHRRRNGPQLGPRERATRRRGRSVRVLCKRSASTRIVQIRPDAPVNDQTEQARLRVSVTESERQRKKTATGNKEITRARLY